MSKTRHSPESSDHAFVEADRCRVLRNLRSSPEIFETIQSGPSKELALQRKLRNLYDDELVRAALSLHELRKRADTKFTRAERMWFDRIGLEQATSESIARHKARRFTGPVDDLCCGIGGDAIALAEHHPVRAVDLRESMSLMASWNADVYGVSNEVETFIDDAARHIQGEWLVHIDPDRRSGSRRSVRIEDYHPGLEVLSQLIASRPGGAIKLSPASNFGGKFPGSEIELVSLRGECKEAIVWFGSLAGNAPVRATVLPSGQTIAGDPLSVEADVLPLSGVLYDPDPAVVRAGLLDVMAGELGLFRLDLHEEYLSSGDKLDSPFVTPFAVLADLPNNDKVIRRYFREHPFGSVEIKCRHIPVDVEGCRRKLSLHGTGPITLIFARIGGRSRALICRRIVNPMTCG